jgi:hypothetical protein
MPNVGVQCEASVRDRGIIFGARIGEEPTRRMDPQILDLAEYTEVQYLRLVARGERKGFRNVVIPRILHGQPGCI